MEFPKGEAEKAHLRPDIAVTETVLDEEPTAAAIVHFSTREVAVEALEDQDPAERVERFLIEGADRDS